MSRVKLLGISGSLRKDSFNTAILAGVADAIADRADLVIHRLHDVPPYNQDDDHDQPPAAVAALREAIAAADGVIVATPEYNQGMSGVMKNAIDWASRPYGSAPLINKPVLPITSSPGVLGGARIHHQITATFLSVPCRLPQYPQIIIASIGQKVTNGKLTDPDALKFVVNGVDALIDQFIKGR